MGKNKQKKLKGEAYNPEEDNREPKEDSMERDKRRGWDHEAGTYQGRDMSWAMMDTPPRGKELIYVKKADETFVFSPRPKNDVNQRRGGLTLPHSMLGKGESVIGAGECETDAEGKIERADNFSGHYQPGEKNLEETKKNMEGKGLSSESATFEVFDKSGEVIKTL